MLHKHPFFFFADGARSVHGKSGACTQLKCRSRQTLRIVNGLTFDKKKQMIPKNMFHLSMLTRKEMFENHTACLQQIQDSNTVLQQKVGLENWMPPMRLGLGGGEGGEGRRGTSSLPPPKLKPKKKKRKKIKKLRPREDGGGKPKPQTSYLF